MKNFSSCYDIAVGGGTTFCGVCLQAFPCPLSPVSLRFFTRFSSRLSPLSERVEQATQTFDITAWATNNLQDLGSYGIFSHHTEPWLMVNLRENGRRQIMGEVYALTTGSPSPTRAHGALASSFLS